MSFQKTNDNYNNDNCIHKRSCRFILKGLLDTLVPKREPIVSLTLPALNFEFETLLVNDYRPYSGQTSIFNFCEINRLKFERQVGLIPRLNSDQVFNRMNCDIFDFESVTPLNLIWLDLCGYLKEDIVEKLKQFLENNPLRKQGVFGITLMSSRQSENTKEFYKRLQKQHLNSYFTSLQNFRNIQLPKILEIILNNHTRATFTLQANYTYKPSSGGGIMTMYAFSWQRE